ncbi:hypothetical protein L3X38_031124 [Prunus dulcis]|uniref:Uncharacterized protein n=1 Tax=Prunus dulcis TaxID=3755 RepID=A0AAD4VDQ8_PRUDU|nr:hypothetical protein L3X38_031124 [Prunus dulcis]
METIVILVCYNGKWVTSKKMCKYEGGDSKGLIVPRTIKFAELLDLCIRLIVVGWVILQLPLLKAMK